MPVCIVCRQDSEDTNEYAEADCTLFHGVTGLAWQRLRMTRSFVVLSILAVAPVVRISFYDTHPIRKSLLVFGIFAVALVVVALLAWKRMARFRELSETTVFRAYLAIASEASNSMTSPK